MPDCICFCLRLSAAVPHPPPQANKTNTHTINPIQSHLISRQINNATKNRWSPTSWPSSETSPSLPSSPPPPSPSSAPPSRLVLSYVCVVVLICCCVVLPVLAEEVLLSHQSHLNLLNKPAGALPAHGPAAALQGTAQHNTVVHISDRRAKTTTTTSFSPSYAPASRNTPPYHHTHSTMT